MGDAIPMSGQVVSGELRPAELRAEYICMIGGDIITRRQTREATAKYIQWDIAPPYPVMAGDPA